MTFQFSVFVSVGFVGTDVPFALCTICGAKEASRH